MMQIDSPTIDIAKRPKENRIKLLTKVYPSYAKDAEADCRRVIKHYEMVVDGGYWKEVASSAEEYFSTYYGKPIEWFEALKRLLDESTPTPTPTAAEDYTQHLQLAIVSLTREIEQLESLGTRPGSLAASTTGGKYIQHQWVCNGKAKYVKKSDVQQYQQEIERYREVQKLRDRLELLQAMVEGGDKRRLY